MVQLDFASLFLFVLLFTTSNAQTIGQLFQLDPTCNPSVVQRMLVDARSILASGQNAIGTLTGSKTFIKKSTRNYMRNARNNFGTQYYSILTTDGLSPDDRSDLATAGGALGMIQTLLTGGTANGMTLSSQTHYLACSDSEYMTTSDATVIDPSLPEGQTTQREYGVPFVFYATHGPVDTNGRKRAVIKPSYNNQEGICSSTPDGIVEGLTVVANTFSTDEPVTQMILCPIAFNGQPDIYGIPYRTTIKPSPGPKSNDLKRRWKFTAGLFVHELFHVLSVGIYMDRTFETKDGYFRPYGPQNIFNIATNANNEGGIRPLMGGVTTLDQPDAYRLFCESCAFPGTRWDISGDGG